MLMVAGAIFEVLKKAVEEEKPQGNGDINKSRIIKKKKTEEDDLQALAQDVVSDERKETEQARQEKEFKKKIGIGKTN